MQHKTLPAHSKHHLLLYILICTYCLIFTNLKLMNFFASSLSILALSLLAGCSVFQSGKAPTQCPVAPEPPPCPVCASPEQLQCPEPQVIEKIVTVPAPAAEPATATTAGKMHLPIIGAVEWVTVEPGGIRMEARIDTGAETSSIHAENIQLEEKDGKRYVSFSLLDPASGEKVAIEQRLRRKVLIRQSEGEPERRYVVRMWLTLGEARTRVDVTLTDRQFLDYPLLVGRNFLIDTMIVDVSQQHLLAK